MEIDDDVLCDEDGCAVVYATEGITSYIHRVRINITDKLYLGSREVTDAALLEHKDQILYLGNAIRCKDLVNAKRWLELLKLLDDLLDKKIQYALERDYFVDDYNQCTYTVHYNYVMSDGGKIFTIMGHKFPVIYSDLDDEEIVGRAYYEFKRRMCEPYPPVVKSARNFTK